MARLRVLIADDTATIRALLRSRLLEEECDVVGEATNGREAIELAEQIAPDLVIMDYQMPVMGGIEATLEIKRTLPTIEILGYTSVPFDTAEREMLEAGASESFDKLHLEELIAAIHTRIR